MKDHRISSPFTRRKFMVSTAAGLASFHLASTARANEPEKPSELIVRAWGDAWGEALDAAVTKPFTAATGINIRYDNGNDLEPKIWAAIAQKRQPPIHVNWDTASSATKSAMRGACIDLGDLSNIHRAGLNARPKGLEGYPMANLYGYVYALAYRKSAFPDGPPKSWNVMRDPKFKARIALYEDGSGIYYPALVAGGGKMDQLETNMQPAWDFISALRANNPLLGWDPDHINWLRNGEIDLVCTIATNAREAAAQGEDIGWVVPDEGAKYGADCLWIPRGNPENEEYWAKRYVDMALTATAQLKLSEMLQVAPVDTTLPVPTKYKDDLTYPVTPEQMSHLFDVSLKSEATNLLAWIAKFKEIMRG